MKRMSNWVRPLAVAALLGATASAQGQGMKPIVYEDGSPRPAVATGEQPGTGYAGAPVGTTSPHMPYGTYGQTGDCCPTDGNEPGWLIHADWLYWKAHRNGLDFAINDGNDPLIGIFGPADVARIRPDHDSGFRIGVFRQSSSGLDFGVRYTNFESDTSTSLADPDGVSLATRIHPDIAADVDTNVALATSSYDLDYELLDLETGYRLEINCDSSVRPFAGIRFAQIDQGLSTVYADELDLSDDVVLVSESMDMDSWGLYAGSEGQFGMGRFQIFGRGAVGLHHARFDGQVTELDVDAVDLDLSVTDGDRRIVASLEAQVGLGYQVHESCRGGVDLQVGYDIQKWFNMADFVRFNDDVHEQNLASNDSSLGLDGWFVRLLVTR